MPARETVAARNVNHPGSVVNVDAAKYRAMRWALLASLPKRGAGLTQAGMLEAVRSRLPQDLFPGGAKAAWWMKTVQLDLEARGEVVRDTTARPLRWKRA